MSNQLRRALALTLSLVLCMGSIPVDVIAEEWEQTQPAATVEPPEDTAGVDASESEETNSALGNGANAGNQASQTMEAPKVLYRVHAQGDAAWTDEDETWLCALSSPNAEEATNSTDSSNKPIDALELKTTFEVGTVEYRLLGEDLTWQDAWTPSGKAATISSGVHGIQVRLSDDIATEYDLWYRSRTVNGTWLGWTHAGEASGSANAPLAEVQFALCATDDKEPADASNANGSPTVAFEEAAESTDGEDAGSGEATAGSENNTTPGDMPNATGPETANESEATTNESEAKDAEASEAAAGDATEGNATAAGATTADSANRSAPSNASSRAAKTTSSDESAAKGTGDDGSISAMAGTPTIEYQTHVQTYGWQGWVKNGAMAGTSGESKRLEAMRIRLKNASGSVVYQTHAQTYGWLNEVSNGELSGTSGESKRLEAIKIHLTGAIANTYDVWYRCHVQTYGWQGWVKNGVLAGTSGQSKRVEALEIRLVKKGDATPAPVMSPDVEYQTHVQTYGWQDWRSNGEIAGTSGESKRLEAMCIRLRGVDGGVRYRTHVQTYGWQDWRSNGEMAGTSGESKRLEGIQISLTGEAANTYDIWYRCHVQRYGWLGWTKNGAKAGTEGGSLRMEALQIKLLPKGSAAPGNTDRPYVIVTKHVTKLDGVDISGWDYGIDIDDTEGDFFIIKATEGVEGTIYNPWYKQWANEVLAGGRLLGFYHYANGGDPIDEADSFYEAIKSYKGRAIACLDWEGDGNKKFNTGEDVAWCKKFLDRIQQRFGGTPFLYTSKSYCNAYDWSSIATDYPLWGAEYADMNDLNGYQEEPWQSSYPWGAWGTQPTIHQYSGTGVLKHNGGIDYFDLDVFYGTRADWNRFATS